MCEDSSLNQVQIPCNAKQIPKKIVTGQAGPYMPRITSFQQHLKHRLWGNKVSLVVPKVVVLLKTNGWMCWSSCMGKGGTAFYQFPWFLIVSVFGGPLCFGFHRFPNAHQSCARKMRDTVFTSLLVKSEFLCAVANAFPNRCSESPAPYLGKRCTENARTSLDVTTSIEYWILT